MRHKVDRTVERWICRKPGTKESMISRIESPPTRVVSSVNNGSQTYHERRTWRVRTCVKHCFLTRAPAKNHRAARYAAFDHAAIVRREIRYHLRKAGCKTPGPVKSFYDFYLLFPIPTYFVSRLVPVEDFTRVGIFHLYTQGLCGFVQSCGPKL
jgi:hypothetical protein